MTFEELKEIVLREPFAPCRLHSAGGTTLDLTHRNGFFLTPGLVVAGTNPAPDGLTFGSWVFVSIDHVLEVTTPPLTVPASGK